MRYAVTDLETTGGSLKNTKITEIAIFLTDGQTVIDEYSTLINPERSIPPFITRLTGINDEMVRNAPRFYEIAKEILEFLGDAVFVAHNVGFDYNVLRHEYKSLGFDFRATQLCTVRSSRYVIPGHSSYSLGKLTDALGIELENRHRAKGDALATVHLFHHLMDLDPKELQTFHQSDIRPQSLHPGLDISVIDELPKKTGVYKFYSPENELIYIGKSSNIQHRVKQHLKNNSSKKAIRMREEIASIQFELLGSEAIALLRESTLIKKHQPRYNRALRKDKFPFGLYAFRDGHNYLHLHVDHVKRKEETPFTTFSGKKEAQRFLYHIFEKFELCQKLLGLYPTRGACFQYHTQQCYGACVGEESPESYNERVNDLLDALHFELDNFFIIDRGRKEGEISVILIERGTYRGYGFINKQYDDGSVESWKSAVTLSSEAKDDRMIIQRMLRMGKYRELRQF
ncbi:MAG: exonuclease domain-containing protein [Bacteroidota bacterium]